MITIRDIHKRLKMLPESTNIGNNYFLYLEKAEKVITSGNSDKIMKMIETAVNDTSNSILFETVLGLYDALYLYGNTHNVKVYGYMISEDYVARVRDAKEAQTYLRQKLGRIKSAVNTKPNNSLQKITDAIKAAIYGAQDNISSSITAVNTSNQPAPFEPAPSEAKNEAFVNGYEQISEAVTKAIYCDRILDNYNRISKRFNIDRVIQENIYKNDIDDTIVHICQLIETYDVPDKVKYNTVLEVVWYGFKKNYVDCPASHYTTLITDYFLAKGGNKEMCSKLLEASMVVNKEDYDGDLEVITEEEPEEDVKLETMSIQDQIRAHVTGQKISTVIKEESTNFNKIFNDFKKSDDKNKETKLQWLIRKLYTKNANDIVDGTPSVFNYIRLFFILGTAAINPVITAIAAIADIFVSLHCKRKETEQMLKCFKNEIEKAEKKLKSSEDPDEKARLRKYIDELKKGYDKIDIYYEDHLTDKEIDKKYYGDDDDEDDSFKDIFDDMKDDDFDFDELEFNESFICNIAQLVELYESLGVKSFDKTTISEMVHVAPCIYSELVDVSHTYPEIIDPSMLGEVIEEHRQEEKAKNIQHESAVYGYTRNLISNAKTKMEYDKPLAIRKPITIKEETIYLESFVKVLEGLNEMKQACDYFHPLIEVSFKNSIKLASEKVKHGIQKIKDKDREISKNIDVAANNTKKAIEKSLTTDNREAVIKGSVLPSASKTIKMAITTAGMAAIHPALAVITTLGRIALSKRYKAKERQMIIDEIEIELKMCEKYIEIAESKNDMKALKELLTIQRELERQRQRIKYNMQVKFGQKYYDSKNAPASTINDD